MKSLIIVALSLVTSAAWALPKAPFNALEVAPKSFSVDARSYDFEGIVKLSNCSGSIVAFNGMPMSAKAIVMTNGHCLDRGGFLKPGEVLTNVTMPLGRSMKVYDKNMKLHPIKAVKILYATMTQTDVAFYELNQTYEQITDKTGITPFLLDSTHPVAGAAIDIVSGYWDRGYSCNIDGFVFKLKEADWTWNDSIRYTPECDTIGGTSGSPIIARGERRVIAINNTSNESGKRCAMNNPCEINEAGEVTVLRDIRYGQQTYNVYTCLTPDFRFETKKPECELPR